ncbi:serine hydrolase [Streptomyces sp. NPDC046182]|uniref:D-alanyl-D-alanine carboxypeptidase family protein n=1 Tax=Streptomyces sp. NPDC046182 TaxID=3154601 RepID=UPI0033C57F1C
MGGERPADGLPEPVATEPQPGNPVKQGAPASTGGASSTVAAAGDDDAAPGTGAGTPETAPVTKGSAAPSEDGPRPAADSGAEGVSVAEGGSDAEDGPRPEADSDAEGVSVSEDGIDAKNRPNVQGGSDAEDGPQTEARPDAAPWAAPEIGPVPPGPTPARPVAARGDGEPDSPAQARDASSRTEPDEAPSAVESRPAVDQATAVLGTVAPATRRGVAPVDSRTAGGPGRAAPSWARAAEDDQRTRALAVPPVPDTPTANFALPSAPSAATPRPSEPATVCAQEAVESVEAPLNLLAQLTNTPPPAETPRRVARRRVKVWTPLLLLLAGAVAGAQLLRPLPAPQLLATERTHTVEGQLAIPWPGEGQGAVRLPGSGTIGTFGAQKPVPTASVAKIMTAYVVLKDHPLRKGEAGPTITVDATTVAEGRSKNESRIEGLTEGSTYSQLDMLKMLMIPSGNNAARLLARWSTGSDSEAAFVEQMNAAARELGMNDTTYTDPSGLDAGTVSTAVDQLRLAEAAMKDDVFRSVVAMPDAEIKNLSQRLINNNTLLNAPELSIRGIKTGSSTPAGGALVWAGYKSVGDETPLILGALMDQRADGPDPNATRSLALVLANSKKVVECVRGALTSATVVRKGDRVGYIDDGLGGRTPVVAGAELKVVAAPGQTLRLALSGRNGAKAAVPRTAAAGAEVGVLTVGEGAGARSVPVVVDRELSEPSIGTRLTRIG